MTRRVLAELVGTCVLVLAGTGAIVVNEQTNGAVTHPGVAATFGLVVMAMAFALGKVSGCHINPAATLAMVVGGKFPAREAPAYVAAQVAGAFLASLLLRVMFPASDALGSTLPAGPAWHSFVLEVLLTFVLLLTALSFAGDSSPRAALAPIAVGGVVGLEALFAGPICGASMNPARSLAPAIVSGHTEHLWVYLAAPLLGAILAAGVGRMLYDEKK